MKKKWEVHRETYSVIDIEAETYKEAEDMLSEIDGDDDGWEYYNEEIYLRDFSKHTYPNYDEYSMTHTVDRDDDVNEGKSLTVSTWISKLNDMDRILLNRIEAIEKDKKHMWKLINIQQNITEEVCLYKDDIEGIVRINRTLANRIKKLEEAINGER